MHQKEQVTLTNMCMIYDSCGNVLVQEKITKHGTGIVFPGGHVEYKEPIVDSTIREIKEETGLTIDHLQFCGMKDWMEKDGSRYIVFLYKTNNYYGTLQSSREGKVYWMPLEELKKQKPFWHMDQMLELFCTNTYTELFLETKNSEYIPVLK